MVCDWRWLFRIHILLLFFVVVVVVVARYYSNDSLYSTEIHVKSLCERTTNKTNENESDEKKKKNEMRLTIGLHFVTILCISTPPFRMKSGIGICTNEKKKTERRKNLFQIYLWSNLGTTTEKNVDRFIWANFLCQINRSTPPTKRKKNWKPRTLLTHTSHWKECSFHRVFFLFHWPISVDGDFWLLVIRSIVINVIFFVMHLYTS